MACNICGNDEFQSYRGRAAEQCTSCGSKARHRVAMHIYQELFAEQAKSGDMRVLHLAPEACLVPSLQEMFSVGYTLADAAPERYPHAKCLKLFFPDDFDIFPDNYFEVILHNHVLEHIPGHYGEHLKAFTRMLAPCGTMVCSVPGPYLDRDSIEGGEHLASDAERLERFLQEDHLKLLGRDFPETLAALPGGELVPDGVSDEIRESLNVRPGKAPFFVWQKHA